MVNHIVKLHGQNGLFSSSSNICMFLVANILYYLILYTKVLGVMQNVGAWAIHM